MQKLHFFILNKISFIELTGVYTVFGYLKIAKIKNQKQKRVQKIAVRNYKSFDFLEKDMILKCFRKNYFVIKELMKLIKSFTHK